MIIRGEGERDKERESENEWRGRDILGEEVSKNERRGSEKKRLRNRGDSKK
jgi:hypothetical protein